MTMSHNKLCVIIVSYNSNKLLENLVPKLLTDSMIDIVIVNNGEERYTKSSKRVHIINNPINNGYAGGMNIGIRFGLKGDYGYFALTNPDIQVKKNWRNEIYKTFAADSKVGIVQPVIMLPNNKINTIGNGWHYLGFSTCEDYNKILPDNIIDRKIACASGAIMVVKRELIEKIGLLEESYFMYGEDSEYSYRAWKNGYKVYLSASSQAIHNYSLKMTSQKWYLLERNRLSSLFSLYSVRSLMVVLIPFITAEIGLIIISILLGFGGSKIKSYSGIWAGIQLRAKRNNPINLSEKNLSQIISSEIYFPFINKFWQTSFNTISKSIYSIVKFFW